MAAMTPAALQSTLRAEKDASLGVNSAKLAEERAKALDYYIGDVSADMPSLDGRSSAVSTDVADTIDGLMPPLMEIFAASEEVVRFEPVGEEDEPAAEQETDYVNHVFMQKNPGFLILYTFIKDALLSKVGIVKVTWDTQERLERETYTDQPDEVFAILSQAPDVEVLEHTTRPDDSYAPPQGGPQAAPEPGQGGPQAPQEPRRLHTVTLVKKRSYACAKVEPVPPEEFGVSRRTRSLRDSNYCYHQPSGVTQSDLIAQGYDADQIENLASVSEGRGSEEIARDHVTGGDAYDGTDQTNRSMRPVQITEHYLRMDYEGDGKPQLYRVTTGGDKMEVLKRKGKPDVEPVDVVPFATASPIILTHRFFGRSVADLVLDIQKIKTAVLRQMLDNAYLANNPRTILHEQFAHERTLDDLLVSRPGGVVRAKAPGAIEVMKHPDIGGSVFPLMEYLDATREWRTGVTKQGQGIDGNALQNQSATAVNQVFSAAQAKMKLIARILAETGIRDLFALLHGVIRKNDKQANTVRLRNKWVQVDPRNWKTRDDMTINVGLGTGSKEAQVAHLMNVLTIQKEAFLNKLPIVGPKQFFNTISKLIERIDLKSAEPYLIDPESPEGQQMAQASSQQPDPAMQELQAKQQIEEKKLQMQAQLDQMRMQQQAQIENTQAQADIATQQIKVKSEIQLAEKRFELERELKILDAQIKQREHEQKSEQMHQQAQQQAQQHERQASEQREQPAPEPEKPDHTPRLLDIIGQFAARKSPSAVKRTKDGMQLVFDEGPA